LQTPGFWHCPGAAHCTGFVPTQVPFWQVSVCVHALLSLQAVPVSRVQVPFAVAPAATEHAEHTPPLQGVLQHTPLTHDPLRHVRPLVQAVPFTALPPRRSAVAVAV
jgi:hypothetical protein